MPLVLVAGFVATELSEKPQDKALRSYALAQLAQREYSRIELRRKLLVRVRAGAGKQSHSRGELLAAHTDPQEDGDAAAALQQIDAVLDWLEAHRYLSEQRFVESRVRVRSKRFGNLRILQELAQHGVALAAHTEAALAASEFERAQVIWERKFNSGSGTPADVPKQARFLAGRGFSGEVIRRVVRTKHAAASTSDPASPSVDGETPHKETHGRPKFP